MDNLIGKEWRTSPKGAKIVITNPATGKKIDTVPNCGEEDVAEAVRVAKEEQKNWGKVSLYDRADILYKFVDLVERDKDSLAKLLSDETGKPIKEARAEIGNVKIGVRAFCEKAKHLYGDSLVGSAEAGQEKTMEITTREPLGVVAAIIPFNFPSDLFCQKVPPALLMGNSVIIKPSSYNPLTLIEYTKLLVEAGVPAGVVQILTGDGVTTGQALARNKNVSLVSLTGSTGAGIQTMAACSQNLTHVMLELGGNDAFIFLEDGNMDLAIEEAVWGRLYNGGQVCCASKRFLIHNSRKEEFIEKMTKVIKKIKVGDPSKEETDMGPLINEAAAKRVEEFVNYTVEQGAKIVVGGKRDGAYYYPTILDNVTKKMDVAKDLEIFGPVIPVIGFDTIDEAIKIANQSSYGLCGCVFSENYKLAMNVAKQLECGGTVINGASFYRSFEMPFGGWKHSGIGNEGVSTTLEEMSRLKTIVLKNIFDNNFESKNPRQSKLKKDNLEIKIKENIDNNKGKIKEEKIQKKGSNKMATTRFILNETSFFGFGAREVLADQIKERGFKKILVVTDAALVKAGVTAKVLTELDKAKIKYEVYDEVKPNPTIPNVLHGLDACNKFGADCIVAVGGGSAMDTAKCIAILVTNPDRIDVKSLNGLSNTKNPCLPLICLPTTAGTASEVTINYVITDEEAQIKMVCVDPHDLPILAIVDTELMNSMPKSLAAATGMDALTHAIEGYITKGRNVMSQMFSMKAIDLIYNNLDAAVNDKDQDAIDAVGLGQYIAGMGFSNVGLGIVHSMAHQLGAVYDTPHGLANAIILPTVLEFNGTVCADLYKEILTQAMGVDAMKFTDEEAIKTLCEHVKDLSERVGITQSVGEVGARKEDIEMLADKAMVDPCMPGNPREVTKQDFIDLYEKAW